MLLTLRRIVCLYAQFMACLKVRIDLSAYVRNRTLKHSVLTEACVLSSVIINKIGLQGHFLYKTYKIYDGGDETQGRLYFLNF